MSIETKPKTRCINATPHEAMALHQGRATAIVRRMEPQPHPSEECSPDGCGWHWHSRNREDHYVWNSTIEGLSRDMVDSCPCGRIGDVLAFREAASINDTSMPSLAHHFQAEVVYKADSATVRLDVPLEEWRCRYENNCRQMFSSATIPYWAIRTRRVIASIDVIRLAEMTEAQADMLGHPTSPRRIAKPYSNPIEYIHFTTLDIVKDDYESRHGDGSWATDWVWCITLGKEDAR